MARVACLTLAFMAAAAFDVASTAASSSMALPSATFPFFGPFMTTPSGIGGFQGFTGASSSSASLTVTSSSSPSGIGGFQGFTGASSSGIGGFPGFTGASSSSGIGGFPGFTGASSSQSSTSWPASTSSSFGSSMSSSGFPFFTGMTTVAPPFKPSWDKSAFDKEAQDKYDSAFDGSGPSFSGDEMFNVFGKISRDFLNSMDAEDKQTVTEIENMNVLDMKSIFNRKTPAEILFFLGLFRKTDQDKLDTLVASPLSITPSDVPFIPLKVLTILQPLRKVRILTSLTDDVKDTICDLLQNGEADYDTTKELDKSIDCKDSLQRSGEMPRGNLKEAMAANYIARKSPATWTQMDWNTVIRNGIFSGLPTHVIERAPASVIKNNAQYFEEFTSEMDDRLKAKLFAKLRTAYSGLRNMTSSDLQNMKGLMKDMSLKEMKELDPSAVLGSVGNLKDSAKDMSDAQKLQIRKVIKEGKGSAANWTKSDILDAMSFQIGRDRESMKAINKDEVINNIAELGQKDVGKISARSFAKKLRQSADFDQATDFDTTKFRNAGSIMKGFPSRIINDMASVDFGSLLDAGNLKNISFPKESAKVLIQRCITDASKAALTSDDLMNLGDNIQALTKAQVDNMDADELAEAVSTMKTTFESVMADMDETTIDGIVKKLETSTGGLGDKLESAGGLLQYIPVPALKALPDSDFGDLTGAIAREFNCSKETCPEIYERIVKQVGRPGLKNPNVTLSLVRKMGRAFCGIPLTDLRALPAVDDLEGIAGHLCKMNCLSDKQEKIFAIKVMFSRGALNGNIRQLNRQDAKAMGCLFKHFDQRDLVRFGYEVCDDLVQELGSQDLSNVPKRTLNKLTEFALWCRNKTRGTLTTDDMSSLGDLVCGLGSRVNDLDTDALQDATYRAQKNCPMLNARERQMWASKAMTALGINAGNVQSVDDVTLTQMGTLLADVPANVRSNIPDSALSSVAVDIVEQFEEREKLKEKRKQNGLNSDVTKSDVTDEENKKLDMYEQIKDAFMNTARRRRRRRSAGALSCDDMQMLGAGVTSMSTSEIEALTDVDFLDCASFLGGFSTWTTAQKQSLLSVAIRTGTYGAASGWTTTHVYSAGIITQALTSAELSALTSLDDDAMYSIGRHAGWEEAQLIAGFARWLDLNKGNDASTVTSTELIALGHFVCGATTNHITAISSTAYGYTASYIGKLTSCDEAQMVAFADHAEAAFGAITAWDTSVVTSVGTMIGGLSSTELASLTTTQIAAIEPNSISVIPAASFVGFTPTQLSSFSVSQAQSTTNTQHAGLSSAQKEALVNAGATVQSSSASGLTAPLTLMLCVAALSTVAPRW